MYIYNNDNQLIKYGYADVPSFKLSRYLNDIDFKNDVNIECSFNSKNNKWTPNLITDKDVHLLIR